MMENSTGHAILGYHSPGDYFYFSMSREGHERFGIDTKNYKSSDSFVGLISAVHEHYHLMQELTQGLSWWRQHTGDWLALHVSAITRDRQSEIEYPLWDKPRKPPTTMKVEVGNPLWYAKRLSFDLDIVDRQMDYPELTASLLDAELRASPHFSQVLIDEVYTLTTMDLLECHAAVLTELYISQLLVDYPDRFDRSTARQLESAFRLKAMPRQYGKALRALIRILDVFHIRSEMHPSAHESYSHIDHGDVYVVLAFLLDYALHVPPHITDMLTAHPDGCTMQDIYPPMRFLSLAILYAALLAERSRAGDHYAREDELYSVMSGLLAQRVNRLRASARPPSPATGRPIATFFEMGAVTQWWLDQIGSTAFNVYFPEVYSVYRRCIEFRLSTPDLMLSLKPPYFDYKVQLPKIVLTPRGLIPFPYFTTPEELRSPDPENPTAELLEYIERGNSLLAKGLRSGDWQTDQEGEFADTFVPFKFIESLMAREIYHRLALSILHRGTFRCPLTDSIGRYVPCSVRTEDCENITRLNLLPAEGCKAREIIDQQFCQASCLRRK